MNNAEKLIDNCLVSDYHTHTTFSHGKNTVLENAKKELGDKVNVVKIDVDESEEIARKYGVMSIPTMVIIKNGEELDRMVGLLNKQAIIDRVNKNL